MNNKKNKYVYEFAQESDGKELAELLDQTSFEGNITLAYARRENAYNSIKKESEKFVVVIGRDKNNNEICGMGICSIKPMLIKGSIKNIAYLSGFRRKKNIGGDILKMYKMLEEYCKNNGVEYTYTTILDDNIHAQKMLTKKRKSMPDYIKISDYTVNILKTKMKYKSSYTCNRAEKKDFELLKSFIDNESKNKTFFPYFDLNKEFFGLSYKDFYLLKDKKGEILACGILWNQKDYKQLIVKNYSFFYKLIKTISNPFLKFINYPILPNKNEIVDYSTLSFVLYKNNDVCYLNDFIKQVSHFVKESFFVYASTKELTKKITPITYKSSVYIVDWDKNFDYTIDLTNLYIECALL